MRLWDEACSYGWQKRMSLNVEKIYQRFFRKFGLTGFLRKEWNQLFLTTILFYKCYILDWVLDGGNRTCSAWGIQVWTFCEKNESSVSWNFRILKTLMQGTQIDKSPMEKLYTITKFLMATPIEEMKSVVLVKYEFEYRENFFFSF